MSLHSLFACLRRVLVALLWIALPMVASSPAVAGACTVSTTGLAFGPYQPLTFAGKLLSADKSSDATVSVVCTGIVTGGNYSIALGPSTLGSSFEPRYLAHSGGGSPMAYNIYRDAAFTSLWGDGFTGPVLTGSLPVGDSQQSHTVFGRVPGGQHTLQAGTYSGGLTMTIRYEP